MYVFQSMFTVPILSNPENKLMKWVRFLSTLKSTDQWSDLSTTMNRRNLDKTPCHHSEGSFHPCQSLSMTLLYTVKGSGESASISHKTGKRLARRRCWDAGREMLLTNRLYRKCYFWIAIPGREAKKNVMSQVVLWVWGFLVVVVVFFCTLHQVRYSVLQKEPGVEGEKGGGEIDRVQE